MATVRVCDGCNAVLTRPYKCGACREAVYCGPSCQKAHWTRVHKAKCRVQARARFLRMEHEVYCNGEGAITRQMADDKVAVTWTLRDEWEHGLEHLQSIHMLLGVIERTEANSSVVTKLMIRALQAFPVTTDLPLKHVPARLRLLFALLKVREDIAEGVLDVVDENVQTVEELARFRDYTTLVRLIRCNFLVREAQEYQKADRAALLRSIEVKARAALADMYHTADKEFTMEVLSRLSVFVGRVGLHRLQVELIQAWFCESGRNPGTLPYALLALSDALIWLRRFTEAEKHLRIIIKKTKDIMARSTAELRLATIAWERRNYTEALRLAKKAQQGKLGDYAARNATMITYICSHLMGQEPDFFDCLHDLRRERYTTYQQSSMASIMLLCTVSSPWSIWRSVWKHMICGLFRWISNPM